MPDRRPAQDGQLLCPHCSQPLGAYEPLILDRGDGAPVRVALTQIPPELREGQSVELLHADCYVARTG